MAARELGNPLGNPLARSRAASFNDILVSHNIAVDNAIGTVVYPLPFAPGNPARLDIVWTNNDNSGSSGMALNKARMIPFPSGDTRMYLWTASGASTAIDITYRAATNDISVVTTGATYRGLLQVLLRDRTLVNAASVVFSTSESPLPFTIKNPAKTFLGPALVFNSPTVCLETYLSASDIYSWHLTQITLAAAAKITGPNAGICRSSTTANLLEFE